MTPPRRRPSGARVRDRRGYIRLRVDQFDLMTRVLGYTTDTARAQLIGMDAKTIARACAGQLGHDLIAHILISLDDHRDELAAYNLTPTFDTLFEVVKTSVERPEAQRQR